MSSVLNNEKSVRVWQRKGAIVERVDRVNEKPVFTNQLVLKGQDEKTA